MDGTAVMASMASMAGMVTLGAILGAALGVALGVVLTRVARRVTDNPYAKWLGRRCWVRPIGGDRWEPCVIVAVSWHGAVCVRDAEGADGRGYWVKKQNVPFRVTFKRPEE